MKHRITFYILVIILMTFGMISNGQASDDTLISNYEGRYFRGENSMEACTISLGELERNLLSRTDLKIELINFQCVKVWPQGHRIQVRYRHTFSNQIEYFKHGRYSEQNCESRIKATRSNFIEAGYILIDSYCRSSDKSFHMRVDYLRAPGMFIRDFTDGREYTDRPLCEQTMARQAKTLRSFGIFPLTVDCSGFRRMSEPVKYLKVVRFASKYKQEIYTLNGDVFADLGLCELLAEKIENNFTNENFPAISSHCITRIVKGKDDQVRTEYRHQIIYVDQPLAKVKKYTGGRYEDIASCQMEIVNVEKNMAANEKAVLYSFCRKTKGFYTPGHSIVPVVYHTR